MKHLMVKWMVLPALGVGMAGAVQAQLTNAPPAPIVGARMPALSPDGKQLAFVYRGDIWLAPAKGGRARQLAAHVEVDAYPLFSPDGQWVAFASKRHGSWCILAAPVNGGPGRQLTWFAGPEIPQGWRPDSQQLVFSSRRDTPHYALYGIDVRSLRTEMLREDYATMSSPNYSPDGKLLVYARYGFHWTRPRYRGSAAAQLWLLDVASQTSRPLTTNGAQHLWPRFLPDGKRILTVTTGEATPNVSPLGCSIAPVKDNPLRTPNLWVFDLKGNGKPLTSFVGGAVRYPNVASKSGDIAFEYGADLWLMRRGRGTPQKITLYAAADDKQNPRRKEKSTKGVTEAEPSPDGKTYAFGLHGDIWSVLIDKPKGPAARNAELARRLTDYVGDDSDFSWSQDGKKLFFTSDREFNTRIYELDVDTLAVKPLWDRSDNISGLRLSPDGKKLGFWVAGPEGGLHTLDLQSSDLRRIVKVPGPQWRGLGGGEYVWSPDLRWIAFTQRGASRAWNIWIVPGEGGEAINVTRLYAHHSQPAWSPDGKYLFFYSNRDGEGLYALPLKPEPFRAADAELKFEKPTQPVTITIEFKDIASRIRKVSSQAPQGDLTVTADGLIVFLSQGDIWSVTYDGKETKRLTTGGGKSALRISKDGKKVYFIQNGELHTMGLDSKSIVKVDFTAEWERDVRAEWQAAFIQFWNAYNRGFYDGNFHGRDWPAIRERCEPMLDAVGTDEEFAWLLHLMVGELETSHAEVTPASDGPPPPVTPHLGFAFDYTHCGPGLRVARVPAGAPGAYPDTAIQPGEYVLTINGQAVRLDEKLYAVINDKQDRVFEFQVNTNADLQGARTVRYKAMSQEEWRNLHYRNRVERSRQYVEDQSNQRIGYLHLAAMQANNQAQFEREAYEYIADKDALIIDVRFNTGGNIADTLIDWLERQPHGFLRPRDSETESSPYHAWEKPIVVLINEHSYSNGEIFAYAMRARGLAKLVGLPTPGYVIWTGDLRLVDGTKARMPQTGFYRLDGTTIENRGEIPDVHVPLPPDEWLAGRDAQLDKAIELLAIAPEKAAQ